MNYYLQSKYQTVKLFTSYIVVLLLLVLLQVIKLTQPLQQMLSYVITPLTTFSSQVVSRANNGIEDVVSTWSAVEKLEQLQKENAVLQAEIALFDGIKKENESLKAMIGSTTTNSTQETKNIGRVINYASPLIELNTPEKVSVGSLVTAEGTLLGVITEIFQNQAKVELLSSLQIKPLIVKTDSGVEGILVGNNKRIVITEMPRDATIKQGEKVVTVGQEGTPANIFIGTISERIDQPTSPVLSANIVQPISFFSTTIVEIK